jgi:vacuolar-type H+-ATPase subunit I/STV1
MPRRERPENVNQTQSNPTVGQRPAMMSGNIGDDIRALNSSIMLISQKLKFISRNEKILGRNLMVLNKKIKDLEGKIISNSNSNNQDGASLEEFKKLDQKNQLLSAQIEDLESKLVTKEELKELKYIIDSINPLEFTTISQVKDIIKKSK